MKRLVFLLTVTTLLAGCGQTQSPKPSATPTSYEARESGFSVAFPAEPKRRINPQQTGYGTHQLDSYICKVKPGLALFVTYEELPAAVVHDAASTLKQSVRASATTQNGTVTSETDANQDGHPARVYEIDCGRLVFQGRCILVGRRLYNVAALVTKTNSTAQSNEVKAFLDSFKVLK